MILQFRSVNGNGPVAGTAWKIDSVDEALAIIEKLGQKDYPIDIRNFNDSGKKWFIKGLSWLWGSDEDFYKECWCKSVDDFNNGPQVRKKKDYEDFRKLCFSV